MLSSRMMRAIVAVTAIGWGVKKLRELGRPAPVYPRQATPTIPASETSSPS